MSQPQFDRNRIRFRPLSERRSKVSVEDFACGPDAAPPDAGRAADSIAAVAQRIRAARDRGAPVVLCHGAHLIRNGLGPIVVRLLERGWVTHVATNGAGSIHDWELAFSGKTTEDVQENVAVGEFGIWEETGRWPAVALHVGLLDGLGYGSSVGRLIEEEGLKVPRPEELLGSACAEIAAAAPSDSGTSRLGLHPLADAARRLDVLAGLSAAGVTAGELSLPHAWKTWSVQAAAWRLGVPLTVHPGIGYDIVHAHPLCRGSIIGAAAMRDFLSFVTTVSALQGGVYLSVGSAIMSPMIFEKALSMARNVARQSGGSIDEFDIVVNDLAGSTWDWSRGEPPKEDPAYYVRFCKSFSRMGGRLTYVGGDNRVFLQNLNVLL